MPVLGQIVLCCPSILESEDPIDHRSDLASSEGAEERVRSRVDDRQRLFGSAAAEGDADELDAFASKLIEIDLVAETTDPTDADDASPPARTPRG